MYLSSLLLSACSSPRQAGSDCEPECSDGECAPGAWVSLCPGTYLMGPKSGERSASTFLTGEVTLTRPFEILNIEVTQGMFADLMGFDPAGHSEQGPLPTCGEDCPVEDTTWSWAAAWCNARSEQEGLETCYRCDGDGEDVTCEIDDRYETPYDCPGYRLPTEAEWEYAARAGTRTHTYNGDIRDFNVECSRHEPTVSPIAWYCGNSDNVTHPVGQKLPNQWGLFDMLGNVEEWTSDAWCSRHEARDYGCEQNTGMTDLVETDLWWPPNGHAYVTRSSAWGRDILYIRSASRIGRITGEPGRETGFRPVRTLEPLAPEP